MTETRRLLGYCRSCGAPIWRVGWTGRECRHRPGCIEPRRLRRQSKK